MEKWVNDKDGIAGKNSSKIQEVLRVLKEIKGKEKALIFSKYVSCLDLICYAIETDEEERFDGIEFTMVDGGDKSSERKKKIDNWKNNPKNRFLFMTIDVGCIGLNLTQATHCLIVDLTWHSSAMEQAQSRIHRIGQDKPVTIYNFVVQNSIEIAMSKLCMNKKEVGNVYLRSGQKFEDHDLSMDQSDIRYMLNEENQSNEEKKEKEEKEENDCYVYNKTAQEYIIGVWEIIKKKYHLKRVDGKIIVSREGGPIKWGPEDEIVRVQKTKFNYQSSLEQIFMAANRIE
jgi:superfamily II DNA or RNA helicase